MAIKHVSFAWNCNGHGTKFAQDLMPILYTGAFLSGRNAVLYAPQMVSTVWGEMDCHIDGVINPAQDKFCGIPGAGTLVQHF